MKSAFRYAALSCFAFKRVVGLGAVLVISLPLLAAAQMRNLPDDTERGFIAPLQGSSVLINGQAMRLAPGATIRNQENLIIVPSALPQEGARVEYTLDADGAIFRAWLVTDAEASRERPRR